MAGESIPRPALWRRSQEREKMILFDRVSSVSPSKIIVMTKNIAPRFPSITSVTIHPRLAFFRDGKLIDSIMPDDFPLLEYDFYPVARPYSAGSIAEIDFHCKMPSAAKRMSNPEGSSYYASSYDYDDESSDSSSSSSGGSSSSSSSFSSSSGGSGSSSSGSSSSSSGAGTLSTFEYAPPSNSTVSVRASNPTLRKPGGVSKREAGYQGAKSSSR